MTCKRNVRSPLSQSSRLCASKATRRGRGADASRRSTSSTIGRRASVVHAPDSRISSVSPLDASRASPALAAGASVVINGSRQFPLAICVPS